MTGSSAAQTPESSPFLPGLGGAGSGTGLVGGGLEVGADTTIGKIMLLASPITSVLANSFFAYVQMSVKRFLHSRAADRARRTLKAAINNPDLPDDEREEMRKKLARFERSEVARELERVKVFSDALRQHPG